MWSIQTVFATGTDVWDVKFPVCIIAHECMRDKDIKFQTHQKIADVLAWSFKCAQSGLWPLVGPTGESFSSGDRKTYAGQKLAGGYYKGCSSVFGLMEKQERNQIFPKELSTLVHLSIMPSAARAQRLDTPSVIQRFLSKCSLPPYKD